MSSFRTYKSQVVSLLGRCSDPAGLHRSEILTNFPQKKETYVLRAIVAGVREGSILDGDDGRFSMNWKQINDLIIRRGEAEVTVAPTA